MGWNTSGPAQLGADNVIRFLDADHFLRELQGNLGRGRAFVRSKRKFDLKSSLELRIEAPGVEWGVSVEAIVVFVKDGFVGLEFEDFENDVLPKLDMLGEEAARAIEGAVSQSERTVIAPSPMQFREPEEEEDLDSSLPRRRRDQGSAQVQAFDEEERTGEMYIPPDLAHELRRARGRPADEITSDGGEGEVQMIGVAELRRELSGDIAEEIERSDNAASEETRDDRRDDSDLAQEVFATGDSPQEVDPADNDLVSTRANVHLAPRRQAAPVRRRGTKPRRVVPATPSSAQPAPEPDLDATNDAIERKPALRTRRTPSGSRLAHIEAATMRLETKEPPAQPPQVEKIIPDPAEPEPVEAERPPPDRADTPLATEEEARALSERSAAAHAASEPDPTPPAPEPEPAERLPTAPPIVVAGAEALADKRLHIARATSSGVLRSSDAGSLLGLYLAELRHGHLTMLGGPEGAPGDVVKIRVAAGFVITLECTIVARVGEWLTVRVHDPSPIRTALADIADAWREAIAEITPELERPRETTEDLDDSATRDEAADREARGAAVMEETEQAGAPGALPELIVPDLPADLGSSGPAEAAPEALPPEEPETPAAGSDLLDIDAMMDAVHPQLVRDERAAGRTEPDPTPAEPPPAEVEDEPGPELPPPRSAAPPPAPEPPPQPPPPAKPATNPSGNAPIAAAEPGEDGPPQVPKLNGDLVTFARPKDLRHELEANLKNGGLFVESPAIALRTHKSLRVAIGGFMTGVRIEADVVFAAGGRVGFSVGSAPEVKTALEKAAESYVEQANAASPSPAATIDLVPHILAQPPAADAGGLAPFSGRIGKPLTPSELLDFPQKHAKSGNDLVAAPVLSVFELVCRGSARGVLTLRSGDRRATIYVHEGNVAFVESQPFEEETSLGRMLVTAKKIGDPALREGLDRAKQQRRPLGRVLVSLGSITKKVLSEILREQTRVKLETMLGWKDGTHEWTAWREPPGDADLVLTKAAGIQARYLAKRYEAMGVGDLESMFGRNMGRIIVLNDNADTIGINIGLQQKELRFLEVSLVGERTVSDAVLGSPLGRLASLRLIATALGMGMLTFRDGRIGTHVGKVRPKSDTGESPEIVALRRDLKERLGLLKGLNHFEVLGVHWSAHYRAYRAPYEKVKRELDIARGTLRDAPAEVQELAREIMRITEKAYQTLSDEKQRVSYRNQFFDKTERQYSADMLVKQGEVALMRSDRVGAIEALETAVELDPSARNRSLLASAREGKT